MPVLAERWEYSKKMGRTPTPRPGVYETYWYFAAERQAIFERRASGERGPWTDDPILQEFKFCNVFRATDRVSQYMIRNVCYPEVPVSAQDAVFQVVAFRTFSWPETWEGLRRILGRYPTLEDLASGSFEDALDRLRSEHGKLYTGAFILCANDAFGRHIKHLNHVELFRHMFLIGDASERILAAQTLEEVFGILRGYPLFGDFMAYQTAIDLNYSPYVGFSEDDFTKAGPGAIRGIRKVFEDTDGMSPSDVIMWMVEHQQQEFERLGLTFAGLRGRQLHAIDAQGLFCETDKYCRIAFPELSVGRKRMKSKFTPDSRPIAYFFPPKWGINGERPAAGVAASDQGSQIGSSFRHTPQDDWK